VEREDEERPAEVDAEQQDPESSAAVEAAEGEEPDEGKQHDV